ncbi:MAG: hypothetical protein NVS4B3_19190 [Gemmatimonadaceae bacterium]
MIVLKVCSPGVARVVSAERFEREIQHGHASNTPHNVPLLAARRANDLLSSTRPYVTRLARHCAIRLVGQANRSGECAQQGDGTWLANMTCWPPTERLGILADTNPRPRTPSAPQRIAYA